MIDFNHWRGSEIADQMMYNLQMQDYLQTINYLSPKLSLDGDKYCYLYGELPNDCVVGFGKTAHEAMVDFCKNFNSYRPINNHILQGK